MTDDPTHGEGPVYQKPKPEDILTEYNRHKESQRKIEQNFGLPFRAETYRSIWDAAYAFVNLSKPSNNSIIVNDAVVGQTDRVPTVTVAGDSVIGQEPKPPVQTLDLESVLRAVETTDEVRLLYTPGIPGGNSEIARVQRLQGGRLMRVAILRRLRQEFER